MHRIRWTSASYDVEQQQKATNLNTGTLSLSSTLSSGADTTTQCDDLHRQKRARQERKVAVLIPKGYTDVNEKKDGRSGESTDQDTSESPRRSSPQTLEFVNLTGSHTLEPAVLSTVRRHAQSQAPGSSARGPQSTISNPGGTPAASFEIQRFRLSPLGLESAPPKRRKLSTCAASKAPIGTSPIEQRESLPGESSAILPVLSSIRIDVLMRSHYESLESMASLRLVAESSCFALSIRDPAFVLLQLCHNPSGTTSQVVRDESTDALAIKTAVVDQIQKRIGEGDQGDATVAAIACLVCYEAVHGELSSIQVHRNGLRDIVQARGGSLDVFQCGVLRRLVAWADVQSATVLCVPPCFAVVQNSQGSSPSSQQEDVITPEISQPEADHIGIFDDLRQLSDMLESDHEMKSNTDWLQLSDSVDSIQIRLLFIYIATKDDTSREDRAWYLAALIYVQSFVWEVSSSSVMVQSLVQRLKVVISPWAPQGDDRRQSEICLWTLFIAGITAVDAREVDWFTDQARPFVTSLRLVGWNDIKFVLLSVCWYGDKLDVIGQRFWSKMQ